MSLTTSDMDDEEEEALLQSDEDAMSVTNEHEDKNEENFDDAESTDDDDEKFEQDCLKEYQNLMAKINDNEQSLVYEDYLKLTEFAHQLKDLEKIRKSYEEFSKVYPLAPNIWKKLIDSERIVCTSETEKLYIIELYKNALSDYYSDIVLEYAEFIKDMPNAEKTVIWKELLNTYGKNCVFGQKLFTMYREQNERSGLSYEEIQKNLIESYLLELKIPFDDGSASYINFKVFFEKNKETIDANAIDWNLLNKNYERAKRFYNEMRPFEEKLKTIDDKHYQEKAETYLEYLQKCDDLLNDDILQSIYERMVTDCCLNENCWMEYIDFIIERDEGLTSDKKAAFEIIDRALRNCSSSPKIYVKKMHCLEEMKESKEVPNVFELALKYVYNYPESHVYMWLEYLSFLRRQTNFAKTEDVKNLRENFDRCWKILGDQFGDLADCNCEILKFWGCLEYGPMNNCEKGKELWFTAMHNGTNSDNAVLWLEFINFENNSNILIEEIETPNITQNINEEQQKQLTEKKNEKILFIRGLFEKSLSKNPDNYEIALKRQRYERCHGSQKYLAYAEKYCKDLFMKINKKYAAKKKSKQQESPTEKGVKRKFVPSDEKARKKTKNYEVKKSPNEKIKSEKASFNKPQSSHAFSKPSNPNKNSKPVRHSDESKIDVSKDSKSIFLSNLDYKITEDDITNGLSELKIVNMDLKKSINGLGRGIGFLELVSEEEVQKALLLDRKILNGRPTFISNVLRDKEKRKKFKFTDAVEPNKLFVKGIPPDTTNEELRQIFEVYGKVNDIRIVYHKSGQPKQIAYVEYENDSSAPRAILNINDTEIRGNKISVIVSAPPPKNKKCSLPSNNKLFQTENAKKPRMSFIPASVQKKANSSIILQNPSESTAQKSNADFRNFLNS